MPKNKVISILVDQELLDKIDKTRLREPRSAFLYRLIYDALKLVDTVRSLNTVQRRKTKPRRK